MCVFCPTSQTDQFEIHYNVFLRLIKILLHLGRCLAIVSKIYCI